METKYLGYVNPNQIVRGEVQANPGDTFICETEKNESCLALVYLPGWREGQGEWNNFKVLRRGNTTQCEQEASEAVGRVQP